MELAREKIKISSEKFEKLMGAKIKLEMMEDSIEEMEEIEILPAEMILETIKMIIRL